jgi:hypothetical protein
VMNLSKHEWATRMGARDPNLKSQPAAITNSALLELECHVVPDDYHLLHH